MFEYILNREFILKNCLNKAGDFNPRALEKYQIGKEHAYQILSDSDGPAACQECNRPTKFISLKKGYNQFCSTSCVGRSTLIQQKKDNTLHNNYGAAGFKSTVIEDKKKATNLKKYGAEYPPQNKDYVKKLKEKFLETYGTTSPATTPEANKKRKETNLAKYGSENPMSNKLVQDKTAATNLNKYGAATCLTLPPNRAKAALAKTSSDAFIKLNDIDWLEKNKSVSSTALSTQLGVAWSTILNYYKKHNVVRPHVIISQHEVKMVDFLSVLNVKYITSDRTILDGKEIDIYLPDLKLGIEINGLYWHSDEYIPNKFYHRDKSSLAAEKGIQLIHITDHELTNKFEIVKNRILAKIGKSSRIFARKCQIVEVSNASYCEFMDKYHIQGTAVASIRLALVHEHAIVAMMSFSKARYNKNYQWELIRYASCGTVVGGAGKLFNHFIKTKKPETIISYADLRWNTGKVYEAMGMNFLHTTSPNYWYIVDGGLSHRTKYQKHKLKALLPVFDENLTEWENMKNNGYTRFWDCGNSVFTWTR